MTVFITALKHVVSQAKQVFSDAIRCEDGAILSDVSCILLVAVCAELRHSNGICGLVPRNERLSKIVNQ